IDRALLRNFFGYTLFQDLGGPERYAPESRTCTLVWNGTDSGVFFLVEKIKADDDRVVLRDDPTGASFVVKLDDEAGILDNSAIGYGTWQVVSPAEPTAAQAEGIRQHLSDWQAAVVAGQGARLERLVDVDSAIDFVLLQELLRNNDAYFLSVHLWRDVDSGLRFTPWDLDLTLGQPTYNDNANPEGWVAYRPAMISGLTAIPDFQDRLTARWESLRQGPWADAALLAAIDAQHTRLGAELAENFAIWPWEQIPLYWPTLPEVAGPEEEYARIRSWLVLRTAWIDENISEWSSL
ncbi:MAG TPA: CotH kinase family protein, partial [Myxococcota bacterium]|nr:CotH kinase family protein [Myxococcota bacterium]